MNKKILLILVLSGLSLNSCDLKGDFYSLPKSSSKAKTVPNKEVRGPTGGGAGGGIIVVEKNGIPLPNKKYDIYLQENGGKEKLQSGTTDSNGKIILAESKLPAEKIEKLQNGSLKIIIETYEGNTKSAAKGRIIIDNDSENEMTISAG